MPRITNYDLKIKNCETRISHLEDKKKLSLIQKQAALDACIIRYDKLISKEKQDIEIMLQSTTINITCCGTLYKNKLDYQKHLKTKTHLKTIHKHCKCLVCGHTFIGYTLDMYKNTSFYKKKETKYWKHMQINGGNCIKHCVDCGVEYFSIKQRKEHKCKGETIQFDKTYNNTYLEPEAETGQTSDSNISMSITETETESNSSEYESSEYESSEYDASAILESAKFIPKPINTTIEYLTEGPMREFKINGQQYYHRIRDNKVLNWDCNLEVGTVENNNLVLFSK
jgi:hypothetical protein